MRGSTLNYGQAGMGQGGIYTHWGRWGLYLPSGGSGWRSALTISSFPTHVTLHEGDDPDAGCQEAIAEPGEEGYRRGNGGVGGRSQH